MALTSSVPRRKKKQPKKESALKKRSALFLYIRDSPCGTMKMLMVKLSKKKSHLGRSKRIYTAGIVVLIVAALLVGLWYLVSSPSYMLFGDIVTHVETDKKVVALTFDDGPLPVHTKETLDILQSINVKATFFTIGVESERHPKELQQLIVAGQEIGNHGYSHRPMVGITPAGVGYEIEKNDTLIKNAGYSGTIPYRVAYNIKFLSLPYYLAQHNRPDISRDVITNEGYQYSAETIATNIVNSVRPGSIVLLHPMYDHTASTRAAIRLIVNELRAKGYEFVTVSQLLTYKNS